MHSTLPVTFPHRANFQDSAREELGADIHTPYVDVSSVISPRCVDCPSDCNLPQIYNSCGFSSVPRKFDNLFLVPIQTSSKEGLVLDGDFSTYSSTRRTAGCSTTQVPGRNFIKKRACGVVSTRVAQRSERSRPNIHSSSTKGSEIYACRYGWMHMQDWTM